MKLQDQTRRSHSTVSTEPGHPVKQVVTLAQVRRRIRYLEELQDKHDELEDQFEEEMRAVEKKYRALYGERLAESKCWTAMHPEPGKARCM